MSEMSEASSKIASICCSPMSDLILRLIYLYCFWTDFSGEDSSVLIRTVLNPPESFLLSMVFLIRSVLHSPSIYENVLHKSEYREFGIGITANDENNVQNGERKRNNV